MTGSKPGAGASRGSWRRYEYVVETMLKTMVIIIGPHRGQRREPSTSTLGGGVTPVSPPPNVAAFLVVVLIIC